MNESIETEPPESLPQPLPENSEREVHGDRAGCKKRALGMGVFFLVLTGAYGVVLLALVRHALATEMHSHVVLVPAVTVWLLWTDRDHLEARFRSSGLGAFLFAVLGAVGLAMGFGVGVSELSPNDHLAAMTASYLAFLVAGAFAFLGGSWLRKAAFPVFFLIFMIPLPDGVVIAFEEGLVLGSAEATDWLFQLSGTPTFRVGQAFHLPGFSLQVAQECSGIRSSWVLFITSLLASHLFLRSRWRQVALVAFVIPLGIVRNGLRILVIGLLCVHQGPHMIDSWIHRHGGPVFFALSLVPLFLLLWWLRRGDLKAQKRDDGSSREDREGEQPAAAS